MRMVLASSAIVAGLITVGLLMLLESVMRAFSVGWALPFSPWWGLVLGIPALAMARFITNERDSSTAGTADKNQ